MSLGSPFENQSISPRMGWITNVLTIASAPSMIIASIWMAMIENTSPPSQRSTGSSKLAIHAGFKSMKISQMHASPSPSVKPQMAVRRSKSVRSLKNACTKSTSTVPPSLGHGGWHSAQAEGAGRPPSRAIVLRYSQRCWHSSGSEHVIASCSLPLTCEAGTSSRGKSNDVSASPIEVT